MTEEEAKALCFELASTSPDRETHSWIPRQGEGGEWSVVRLAIPPLAPTKAKASKSPESKGLRDDPRAATEQNVPPHSMGF